MITVYDNFDGTFAARVSSYDIPAQFFPVTGIVDTFEIAKRFMVPTRDIKFPEAWTVSI